MLFAAAAGFGYVVFAQLQTDSTVVTSNTNAPVAGFINTTNTIVSEQVDEDVDAAVVSNESVVETTENTKNTDSETPAPDQKTTETASVPVVNTTTATPASDAAKQAETTIEAQKAATPEKAAVVAPEQYRATITVRGAGGGGTYQFDVDVGSTVEQAMKKATATGFSYKTKQFGGLGTYVTTINGQAEDSKNNMRWIFSVNNKKATAGISTVKLKKGDTIQWSYEKSF